MPRSLRIEKSNGIYHIINHGNYRRDLFINEGSHQSLVGTKDLKKKALLGALGKSAKDCVMDKKSAEWKIQIAAALKQCTSASNAWIAQDLNMGVPHAVSRYVGMFKDAVTRLGPVTTAKRRACVF